MNKLPYRLGVVLVLRNEDGLFLLGKRKGMNVWQFPQGGKDLEESFESALFREALEEIGCQAFNIVSRSPDLVSYDFPKEMTAKIAQHYCGQSQIWFLCELGDVQTPDLSKAKDEEFEELRWASLKELLADVVDWKKQAYLLGLKSLQLI